jgi:hypothetical protein
VLGGEADDLGLWLEALKQSFDPLAPWVMETKDGLILRSGPLDGAATASEARRRVEALVNKINGAIRVSRPTAGVVWLDRIAEILSDGTARRFMFWPASGAQARNHITQISSVLGSRVVDLGLDDKPKPPPPPKPPLPSEPSEVQRSLRIAAEDDLLADALTYFSRGDDRFDVYNALECLEIRFGGKQKGRVARFRGLGWADPDKIRLLKQTANSPRHARVPPPAQPMERTEGRDLLAKLIARAFDEARKTRDG